MDADCVSMLNGILRKTSAKIVLASAWRYFVLRGEMSLAGLQGLCCTHGLDWGTVVGVLGAEEFNNPDRGLLVKQWFAANYGGIRGPYCCLDDLDLGYTKHQHPFVLSPGDKGLAGIDPWGLANISKYLTNVV